uniref:Cell division cycle and apoptosis regulator protein 1 n=1 Tax=Rhizophora mucronata TaxID=61149 RepID=A0A2P2KBP5_RHIMU
MEITGSKGLTPLVSTKRRKMEITQKLKQLQKRVMIRGTKLLDKIR